MTRIFPLLRSSALAILTTAGLFLACAPMAHAQHSRGGGSNSGSSNNGGGNSSGGGQASSGGQSDGGSSGGGHSRSAPAPAPTSSRGSDGASGHAVPRNSGASSGNTRSVNSEPTAVTRDGSNDNSGATTDSSGGRSRDGRATVGRAVPRPVTAVGGGTPVIVTGGGYYGGYYPWGYGGLGFYGYYDPWWYDPYPPVYSGGGFDYDGSLRLKVKPRDASVYIDGYYAGQVDNFDGVFQSLKIESGPHRVEIRLDGYEPLSFDVRIDPDRKTTYEGELKQIP